MRTRLLALALSVVSAGPFLPSAAQAQLAGTWKINTKDSEDPMEKMKSMRVEGTGERDPVGMSSGSGKVRTGTDKTSGKGSVGSTEADRGGGGASAGPMMRFMKPVPQLTIMETDTVVVVNDGLTAPQLLHLDGRKAEEPFFGGGVVEVTAKMKDGKLTIDKRFPDGGSLKQTLSLDKTKRLVVDFKMASPAAGMSLDFRRIYDPAP